MRKVSLRIGKRVKYPVDMSLAGAAARPKPASASILQPAGVPPTTGHERDTRATHSNWMSVRARDTHGLSHPAAWTGTSHQTGMMPWQIRDRHRLQVFHSHKLESEVLLGIIAEQPPVANSPSRFTHRVTSHRGDARTETPGNIDEYPPAVQPAVPKGPIIRAPMALNDIDPLQ